MTNRIAEIASRFNKLPYATDETMELDTCCTCCDEGVGIMDDLGHAIAQGVLEPYVEFFVNAPEDIRWCLDEIKRLTDALEEIRDNPAASEMYETAQEIANQALEES